MRCLRTPFVRLLTACITFSVFGLPGCSAFWGTESHWLTLPEASAAAPAEEP